MATSSDHHPYKPPLKHDSPTRPRRLNLCLDYVLVTFNAPYYQQAGSGSWGSCTSSSLSQHHVGAPVALCHVPGTYMHDCLLGVCMVVGAQDIDRWGHPVSSSLEEVCRDCDGFAINCSTDAAQLVLLAAFYQERTLIFFDCSKAKTYSATRC